jgi:endogenous inhibitor of DNA gyrase (YacG/DUF329 family)
MRCPTCKRQTTRKGNPYRPFCSACCKLLDLDNWLSERYRLRIPADAVNQPEEAPSSQPATKGNHA